MSGSGSITSATQNVAVPTLSGFNDGTLTLSVWLTDYAGNGTVADEVSSPVTAGSQTV